MSTFEIVAAMVACFVFGTWFGWKLRKAWIAVRWQAESDRLSVIAIDKALESTKAVLAFGKNPTSENRAAHAELLVAAKSAHQAYKDHLEKRPS